MDNSNVESFQDDFKAVFTTSSGSMDWQALGEAGNKNPKLMAKVLDQLGHPLVVQAYLIKWLAWRTQGRACRSKL